jgi:AcrR family transcriptional regulator
MGITERRERQKASLRREILDAARAMFREVGFEAVTMRKLAERIEYSPTTIYLYFEDKHDLFQAICEETFAGLANRLDRLHRRGLPPLEELRAGLRIYVDFGLQHPSDYTLTFTHPARPERPIDYHASAGARAFGYLERCVAACVAAGELRRDLEAPAAAQALWAACHGVVSLLIAHRHTFPFVPRRVLADLTIGALIAGLRPAAASR